MASPHPAEDAPAQMWFLEGLIEDQGEIWRTPVQSYPFRVGRLPSADLALSSRRVSQRHAEIHNNEGLLWLVDLGSTNGTFVNGDRLRGERRLVQGDVIHFADQEFRLVAKGLPASALGTTAELHLDLSDLPLERMQQVREMVRLGTVRTFFQPMVRLGDGQVFAYEALGRAMIENNEVGPNEVFPMAENLGLEGDLSIAFREEALEAGRRLPGEPLIFVNTHPKELLRPAGLLESLRVLRQRYPDPGLILEIHEGAATDLGALRELGVEVGKLRIGIAFDDFGIGQARLLELADLEPEFLKFDHAWVHQLHLSSRRRREMVGTLVRLVRAMGSAPLAEGVETESELEACMDLGFEYGQGYYFGHPEPVERLQAEA